MCGPMLLGTQTAFGGNLWPALDGVGKDSSPLGEEDLAKHKFVYHAKVGGWEKNKNHWS